MSYFGGVAWWCQSPFKLGRRLTLNFRLILLPVDDQHGFVAGPRTEPKTAIIDAHAVVPDDSPGQPLLRGSEGAALAENHVPLLRELTGV